MKYSPMLVTEYFGDNISKWDVPDDLLKNNLSLASDQNDQFLIKLKLFGNFHH